LDLIFAFTPPPPPALPSQLHEIIFIISHAYIEPYKYLSAKLYGKLFTIEREINIWAYYINELLHGIYLALWVSGATVRS
jgi:hypothetical protein